MDILELLKNRYSVRDFDESREIKKEDLEKILEAGRVAPTAKNTQSQRILVLQSEEAVAKAREITPSAYNAPTVLIICSDTDEAWKRTNDGWCSATLDSAIVTCHMMLEAASLGIGSCWVCAFNAEKVRKAFDLPENIVPYSMLPLGYPSTTCQPNPRHYERFPIENSVKYL